MEKKEIIAYAITHAPRGVKGGPYEGCGAIGGATAHLGCALRWPDAGGGMWARDALASVRRSVPHARVIRIVRARPSPSEPSAVEVLRELVASHDDAHCPLDRIGLVDPSLIDRARRVLAASGPDPSGVVRAAMRRWEARGAVQREQGGSHLRRASLDHEYQTAIADENRECAKYRKAGGK